MNLNSFMPVKLVTGAGCVRASAKELKKLGKVCLIVTGRNSARACGALQDVTDTLDSNGQRWVLFDEIGQNPRLTDCMAAAEKAVAAGADGIMVEVHNNPSCALCDGAQSLTPAQFAALNAKVQLIREAIQ